MPEQNESPPTQEQLADMRKLAENLGVLMAQQLHASAGVGIEGDEVFGDDVPPLEPGEPMVEDEGLVNYLETCFRLQ